MPRNFFASAGCYLYVPHNEVNTTMPMEAIAEQISFSAIAPQDIAEFHRQRDKIHASVIDRILNTPGMEKIAGDEEKMRIAHESAKVLIENFHATVKYQLPAALLEYLDWLRRYLGSRAFPETMLPTMLTGIRNGAHAFLDDYNSDEIGSVLMQLRTREVRAAQGGAA